MSPRLCQENSVINGDDGCDHDSAREEGTDGLSSVDRHLRLDIEVSDTVEHIAGGMRRPVAVRRRAEARLSMVKNELSCCYSSIEHGQKVGRK